MPWPHKSGNPRNPEIPGFPAGILQNLDEGDVSQAQSSTFKRQLLCKAFINFPEGTYHSRESEIWESGESGNPEIPGTQKSQKSGSPGNFPRIFQDLDEVDVSEPEESEESECRLFFSMGFLVTISRSIS